MDTPNRGGWKTCSHRLAPLFSTELFHPNPASRLRTSFQFRTKSRPGSFSLRINAIGPVDAWFNLATVTLTNTSQLFFDVTAPRQPRRLYRIGAP